jgi:hypothetical protein
MHKEAKASSRFQRYGQGVQKRLDARRAKTVERGVYGNTSSEQVCSATQQMSVFQQLAKVSGKIAHNS